MEYTELIPSPERFRRWTAYSIISGALERRVWTVLSGKPLYPNMLILLIGPAGVGKTFSVREARTLWASTGLFNIAPAAMTKAAFIDQQLAKTKTFNFGGRGYMYNAMLIAVPEFGTILPEYDQRFLSVLCDVWDCLEIAEDKTRKGGTVTVQRPHVNILAGTTPSYLGDILPESAYGQGFTSRIVMVYAGQRVIQEMFKESKKAEALYKKLSKDLSSIAGLVGNFTWEDAAKEVVEDWNRNYLLDAPKHPRLVNYNTRRVIHGIKLTMAISVARSSELLVTLSDIKLAKSELIAVEELMPEIFKEMTTSSDATELAEVHEFLFNYCMKTKSESVPEHQLMHFMSRKIPVNRIGYFLELMLSAGMVKLVGVNAPGHRKFQPQKTSFYS